MGDRGFDMDLLRKDETLHGEILTSEFKVISVYSKYSKAITVILAFEKAYSSLSLHVETSWRNLTGSLLKR